MCRNGNRGNHAGCDRPAESSQDTRMNDSGESRKETTEMKMEVLRAKTKTQNWILHEIRELAQVTEENKTLRSAYSWNKRKQMDKVRQA